MLPFVQERIGLFIVNFFIFTVVCAITLLVCMAFLTATRLCVQCMTGLNTLLVQPALYLYNTGRSVYVKFQDSKPPLPPDEWV
uniref:Envelope small membrane protein n=1 Tax=Middle East respiratory syndrome-related coronavirus TaxID=1335626 RepID=A0A0U2GP61_MERS|nr:envelope protein [Middle East respiratory syndrome-related coronavirus]ALA49555.1 envelope protein [Middle East respiratory syndrome-related coronavirus]ALA49566.1 envelope protein [Middle East respiratory syndrome-related coronavirus]ALA49577.1 envelope protein [Middle East respiratory syndrome-related coronavirus]